MLIILLTTMSSDPADTTFVARLFLVTLQAGESMRRWLTRDEVRHPWVVVLGDLQSIRHNLLDYVRLSSCTSADTYT
jgi:hypothetical protein